MSDDKPAVWVIYTDKDGKERAARTTNVSGDGERADLVAEMDRGRTTFDSVIRDDRGRPHTWRPKVAK